MKFLVKFFSIFVTTITIFVFLLIGAFTIPRLFHINPYVVRSASMEPALPTGSLVYVNANDTEVTVGDIITFGLSTGKESGVYVTHRVYQIDTARNMIQTKGDKNEEPDGFIDASAVAGTVVFHIPGVGFALEGLQERGGFVIIAVSVCLLNGLVVLVHCLDRMNTPASAQ